MAQKALQLSKIKIKKKKRKSKTIREHSNMISRCRGEGVWKKVGKSVRECEKGEEGNIKVISHFFLPSVETERQRSWLVCYNQGGKEKKWFFKLFFVLFTWCCDVLDCHLLCCATFHLILNLSKILCIMNTVVKSQRKCIFSPSNVWYHKGGAGVGVLSGQVWESVGWGRGEEIPKKGAISYLNTP